MWSQVLFKKLAQNSHQGTTCSTYTAAGFVKRNLQNSGFTVNKVKGYGKKREMLVARFDALHKNTFKYADRPWFASPQQIKVSNKKATIIGAGIAGLSMAYSLVKRGWKITLIDRHGDVAKETSGNPAVIVYPRLSVNNDIDTEFYTDAYCYNLHVLASLQNKHSQQFWFNCGLLQLSDEKRLSDIISKFGFNDDFISIYKKLLKPAGGRSGNQVYAEYKTAGVVLPRVLCDVLRLECGDRLNLIQAEITDIKKSGNLWSCFSGEKLVENNEILILANGTGINDLGLALDFPIESIRGQVAVFSNNSHSHDIEKVINAKKHITPQIDNKHYLGATYSRDNTSLEVDPGDNNELFDAINDVLPDVLEQSDYCDAWVGFRTMSKDRVPIVGAVPDKKFFIDEYSDIHHGSTKKFYPPACHSGGLYISAAHGSRGFTSSFVSAEIIAAQVEGVPVPVSKRVLDYLNPSRFIVNDLKRR